ncbi:hypothetical protein D2T29_15925 [Sinirhodobacter populi]|uniref:Hemolysin XhlA n=1 Tax=Paenirhodobacter populi TaxID=2306993 RepID=A0A443K7H0_9RHOB|nr:hypothetical protein [Sinirhodobacter populi]RWR28718.1 hypothetical protein D2T29_15925 [Sinirhodobacter populi]
MPDPTFTQSHADQIAETRVRVDATEARISKLETSEQIATVRMGYIQNSLDAINANINKVVWLVVAAIVGGGMTFIISGGLTLGQ